MFNLPPGSRCVLIALFAVLTAALLVAFDQRAEPAFPFSDLAVTETYTILASQGRLFLGPYSRFSWHHPGPIYFYALVPLYRMVGGATVGLDLGALAVNMCCTAIALIVACRSGVRWLSAAVCTAFALFAVRFPAAWTSVWNPHAIVIPLMALVTCVMAIVAGAGPATLIAVAVLSSLAAQTHVGVALVAFVLAAAASVAAWAPGGRPDERSRERWLWTGAAIVAAAICWTPVLIEQLRGPGHNLSAVFAYFSRSAHGQTWRDAVNAWSYGLSGVLRSDYRVPIGAPVAPAHALAMDIAVGFVLAALVVLNGVGGRPGRFAWPALVPIGAAAVGLLSLRQIPGAIDDHVLFWLSGLGALLVGNVIMRRWPQGRFDRALGALPVATLLIAGGIGVRTLADPPARRASAVTATGAATRQLSESVVAYMRSGAAKPLIKVDQAAWEVTAGVALQLQKAGLAFAIEPEWLDMFTPSLGPDGSENIALTIAAPETAQTLRRIPGAILLGQSAEFSAIVTSLRR
jgi:hypothetical protein